MKRFLVILVTMAAMVSSSQAWLKDAAFWDTGATSISDADNDQVFVAPGVSQAVDIRALWYKVDWAAVGGPMAYFRMDVDSTQPSTWRSYQIGIDTDIAGQDFVEGGDGEAEVLSDLQGIGVDRILRADYAGTRIAPSNVDYIEDDNSLPDSFTVYSIAAAGGSFQATTIGGQAALEWSLPLTYLDFDNWVTVYGAVGYSGEEDASLRNDMTAGMTVSTVPEPTSMAMAGVLAAMGGLKAWRKRKQGQSEVAQA